MAGSPAVPAADAMATNLPERGSGLANIAGTVTAAVLSTPVTLAPINASQTASGVSHSGGAAPHAHRLRTPRRRRDPGLRARAASPRRSATSAMTAVESSPHSATTASSSWEVPSG